MFGLGGKSPRSGPRPPGVMEEEEITGIVRDEYAIKFGGDHHLLGIASSLVAQATS